MKSAVAGILDHGGGLRVVVTQPGQFHHHIGKGERCFIVPGLRVDEPVPWNDIPALIESVQQHVNEKLAPINHCGGCRLCCILPYIDDGHGFAKPSGTTCNNCHDGGCKVYVSRPKPCRDFKCVWLSSQSRNDRMPPELRPDHCGAYFTQGDSDPLVLECHGTPNPDAWKWINEMQRGGYKAKKVTHYSGEKK